MIAYLSEQGSTVSKKSKRLIVFKGTEKIAEIKLHDLEQLVLMGKIQLSTDVVRSLLKEGVDTVYLSQSGRYLGRLSSTRSGNIILRQKQFEVLSKENEALRIARTIVIGKLNNSVVFLRRHNRTLRSDQIARHTAAIRQLAQSAKETPSIEKLRGYEGAAAAKYFSAFGEIVRAPGFQFKKRLRRPPPDPVNILLSLGYTLLTNMMHGFCEQVGLDPYLGALHAIQYGRPSLPLDLVEEFRAMIVDSTVIRVLHTKAIMPKDFYTDIEEWTETEDELWRKLDHAVEAKRQEDARYHEDEDEKEHESNEIEPLPRRVHITQLGLKKFFMAFERRMNDTAYYAPQDRKLSYRIILREQVYALARHLRDEVEYRCFEFGR